MVLMWQHNPKIMQFFIIAWGFFTLVAFLKTGNFWYSAIMDLTFCDLFYVQNWLSLSLMPWGMNLLNHGTKLQIMLKETTCMKTCDLSVSNLHPSHEVKVNSKNFAISESDHNRNNVLNYNSWNWQYHYFSYCVWELKTDMVRIQSFMFWWKVHDLKSCYGPLYYRPSALFSKKHRTSLLYYGTMLYHC